MVLEYIRYTIPEGRHAAFEQAYEQAESALKASPHCLGYEISQCVEDRNSYIVRMEWDSIDGHIKGFRTSPEFQAFFAAVRPFVGDIAEMRHYELTAIKAQKPMLSRTADGAS
jgi:quinol monooxygenase YgiN